MRRETWDIDLMKFIASRERTPFAWGTHDCTLFAADCAHAMTGVDLAAKYRGYNDAAGAARIIQGAGSLRQLVTENVGAGVSPRLARRGDWVLVEQDGREALAVCLGASLIAAGSSGLVQLPVSAGVTAWRVD